MLAVTESGFAHILAVAGHYVSFVHRCQLSLEPRNVVVLIYTFVGMVTSCLLLQVQFEFFLQQ